MPVMTFHHNIDDVEPELRYTAFYDKSSVKRLQASIELLNENESLGLSALFDLLDCQEVCRVTESGNSGTASVGDIARRLFVAEGTDAAGWLARRLDTPERRAADIVVNLYADIGSAAIPVLLSTLKGYFPVAKEHAARAIGEIFRRNGWKGSDTRRYGADGDIGGDEIVATLVAVKDKTTREEASAACVAALDHMEAL